MIDMGEGRGENMKYFCIAIFGIIVVVFLSAVRLSFRRDRPLKSVSGGGATRAYVIGNEGTRYTEYLVVGPCPRTVAQEVDKKGPLTSVDHCATLSR